MGWWKVLYRRIQLDRERQKLVTVLDSRKESLENDDDHQADESDEPTYRQRTSIT